MTRDIVFRPQAEDEALKVRRWYEARREGLGNEFGAEVDELIARIAGNPLAFQRVRGDTRRAVLKSFPYAIYFRETINQIVVLAIHGRQDIRRAGRLDRDIAFAVIIQPDAVATMLPRPGRKPEVCGEFERNQYRRLSH